MNIKALVKRTLLFGLLPAFAVLLTLGVTNVVQAQTTTPPVQRILGTLECLLDDPLQCITTAQIGHGDPRVSSATVIDGKLTTPSNPAAALPIVLDPTDPSVWITAQLTNAGLADDAVHARNILDGIIVPADLSTSFTSAQWNAIFGFTFGSGVSLPACTEGQYIHWKASAAECTDLPQANANQAGLQSAAQYVKVAALPDQGSAQANKLLGYNASGNYVAVDAPSGGNSGSGDISSVEAGPGLEGGGTSGDVTIRAEDNLVRIANDYESGGWTDSTDIQLSVRLTQVRDLNHAATLPYALDQQFQSPNADDGWRVVRVPLAKDSKVSAGLVRMVGDEATDNALEEAAQHILLSNNTITRLGVDSDYAYYQIPLGSIGSEATGGFGGSVSLIHYRVQEDSPSKWNIAVDAEDLVGPGVTTDNLVWADGDPAPGSFVSTAPGNKFAAGRVPGLRLLRSGSTAIPFTSLSGSPIETIAITFDTPLDWDVELSDGQFQVLADYEFVAESPESIQFDNDSDRASGYGIADFVELRNDPVYSSLTGGYKGRPLAVAHIENPANTNAGFVRAMARHGSDNEEYLIFQFVPNPAYNSGAASGSIRITYRVYATVNGGTTPEGNISGHAVYQTPAQIPAASAVADNFIAYTINPPTVSIKRTQVTTGTGADLLFHGTRINPTRELAHINVGSRTLSYMSAASFTWRGSTVPAGGSVPSWPAGAIFVMECDTSSLSNCALVVLYTTARTATAASGISIDAAHGRVFALGRRSSTRWDITGLTSSARSDILAGDLVLVSTGTGATGVVEVWDRVDGAPSLTMPTWTGSQTLTLSSNNLTTWMDLQTLTLTSGVHVIWLDMHLTNGSSSDNRGQAFAAFEFRLVKDGETVWTAPGHERINMRGSVGERAIKELAVIAGSGSYKLQVRLSTDNYTNISPLTWTAANQKIIVLTLGG